MKTRSELAEEVRCFRLRRHYLYLGVGSMIGFALAGGFMAYFAYTNIDGSFLYPKPTALGFGLFWFCWVLVGAYVTACYFREYLWLADNSIAKQGIIRKVTIFLADVSSLKKRHGYIVVRSATLKIRIDLENYSKEETHTILKFFQDKLFEKLPEEWPKQ